MTTKYFNVKNGLTTGANITLDATTGNASASNFSTIGQLISTVATGTAPLVVSSTTVVANLNVATASSAITAGTVTTAAQPNITSVGTLTSLSVSGNANIGNVGTGDLTATGNVFGLNFKSVATTTTNLGIYGATPNTAGSSGGNVFMYGGNGNAMSGGSITLLAGKGNGATLANSAGGVINLTGGTANATGQGGYIYLLGGPSSNVSAGGPANLLLSGVPGDGSGGNLTLDGGGAITTDAIGGNITISGGKSTGAATPGKVIFKIGTPIASGTTQQTLGNILVIDNTGISITGNVTSSGTLSGSGASLTNINASNISSGTLAQARLANSSLTVNGTAISLGGSGTITANTTQTLTFGSYLTGTSFNGGTANTIAVDGTTAATASKVVVRDANANIAANYYTGNGSQLTGISGASVSGTVSLANNANYLQGYQVASASTATTIVLRDSSGNVYANYYYGNGSQLTSLNGSNVTGTVGIATRISDASNGIRIASPGGGSYSTNSSSVAGAIKIKLPVAANNSSTMMRFTVCIYEYAGTNAGTSRSLEIGGYNYAGGGWYNVFATQQTMGGGDINVRFGTDATSDCIWIGDTTTGWAYPQVFITDFEAGYSNATDALWGTGWAISFQTTLDTVELGPIIAAKPLNSQNYNSYAPTLTGGSASGTWSINVTGSAGSATTAGTVTTAAQPNITSVGTLTSLSSSGNITGANIVSTGYILRSVATGISAAGTTQGTGTALTKEMNIVSTVASGANAVVLPAAVAGMVLTITNTSANSLSVFPASGAQINSLGTNFAFSESAAATIQFIAPTSTQWYTVGATYA